MRGGMTIVLVFLICLVIVVLYIFIGRAQMMNVIANLKKQDASLQADLDDIRAKEEDIPRLREQLPVWSSQLAMFKQAIPAEIDDHVFFADLASELNGRELQLLNLEVTRGESWLGQITEEMEAELAALGVNVNAASGVMVAFYSTTVVGDFESTLDAFESLKRHNRLYTLDQVTGPSTAGAGTISATLTPDRVPLTFSGKLYYGISEDEVSQETLAKVYSKAIASPAARAIFNGVKGGAEDVPERESESSSEETGQDDVDGSQAVVPAAGEELALAGTGGAETAQEGWLR